MAQDPRKHGVPGRNLRVGITSIIWHQDVPIAHERRCGRRAPRRHSFLCDGVVFEFGIEFITLDRCLWLGN